MLLGNLLKIEGKKYKHINAQGISFDSRNVKKKDIFFAIKGRKTSGVKFIKDAILNGAVAIVSSERIKIKNKKIIFITVKNVRKSLAEASSNFYKKKPSHIVAVTGTNGKSSVADFFYQILNFNKIPVASIGTLGIISKNFRKRSNLTSADPLSLHRYLNILAKNKINHIILEASSHGLDQKRLDNINIKIGIFTNLSHDHLDYHKNMKSYFNSKMHLFKNLLSKNSTIIADEEIKEFKFIKNIANKKKIKKITLGINSGTIKILSNKYEDNKQIVKILLNSKTHTLKIPLIGYIQLKNLFMAILAAAQCGLNINKIFNQVKNIKSVSGRLECVCNFKNNSNIIIDFAHTPNALEQVLISLKKQFKKEIVIVFGCGGNRDKKKRFKMGKIANKYCKKIFVTDDNPRNEDPIKIRSAIIKGCKKIPVNIGNRKQAIKKAIMELESNEILLVAGKGHENTQDYGKKIIKFSDKKTILEIVKKNNVSFEKNYWQRSLLKKAFKNQPLNNFSYDGVSINSKKIKKNNLFFAIEGKNNDGHKFASEAIEKGAVKSVISRSVKNLSKKRTIKVNNTLSSLNNLARASREMTTAKIIAITGSVGKTTLKNLISFALKNYGKVCSSPQSYNNKFGVPLSLSNLKKSTKYGVFEIGMDKRGEIDNLSKIVKPEIVAITNVSSAHFKNFKTLNHIAKAKSEIIDNILQGGNIILNKDDKFYEFMSTKAKSKGINIVSFSLKKRADIYLASSKKIKNYFRLKVSIRDKIFYFNTFYMTKNFLSNILACISVLSVLNLDLNNIKAKFTKFFIPEGRGDIKIVKKFKKKFKLIDESYNANPLSMSSAVKNMNYYKVERGAKKLVLLGDMLELGKKSKKFHKDLSFEINKSDIDKVYVFGKYIKLTFNSLIKSKKGKVFNSLKEANDFFSKIIHNNDLLMIKGSNATGLNKFSKNIKRGQVSAL